MTDKEKAIVMAYTGIAMLTGDKFDIFHRYIEEKMGRPIWTHELASTEVCAEIKEAAREDFNRLCRETSSEAIPVEWLKKHKCSNIVDLWEKECRLKDTKGILEELLSEHNFKSYNDYVEYAGKITALPRDDRLDILFKEKENE